MTTEQSLMSESRWHAELLQIWNMLLDSTTLTIDDDFFEKGGDSLLATELALEIERRFGRTIPHSLLFEASTVRGLAEILSRSSDLKPKIVHQITGPGAQPPLLFWGRGYYLKRLARTLGAEQPLIVVAPHGLDGENVPRSLEDMAAERLPHILDVAPRGPYRLGGHCVGGMVALEAARLLVSRGHEVEVVAMVDPLWTAAGWPWPKLQKSTLAVNAASETPPDATMIPQDWQVHAEALGIYSPRPLSVPIIVFSSEFDGRPWQQISPDFTLIELPGRHYDWMDTNANFFAAQLRDLLQRNALARRLLPTPGIRYTARRTEKRPAFEERPSFDFGGLAGLSPIDDDWGYSRGEPIDRLYIERFLARHSRDIRGHVLEIDDDIYTKRFGEERVTKSTVLDMRTDNPRANIIADLTNAPQIPDETFDCVILTQVLVVIRDFEAALQTVSRVLKPGGVALITVPGISHISADPADAAGWSWSFYPDTLRSILAGHFDRRKLIVESYGNVKTAIGFLAGLAQEDLAAGDFEHDDPCYPLVVAARAIKPGPILVGPSPAEWNTEVQLEAGPYSLRILGANIKGSGVFTVNISLPGVALASVKSTLSAVADTDDEICVPFNVPPPSTHVKISVAKGADCTVALRAIEVRGKDWSYVLPSIHNELRAVTKTTESPVARRPV